MRYFNGRKVELLAPCGTYEIFKELITTGADSFYCGGKKLNMRLHRKDYNFTNGELKEAVATAHRYNKKVYVTVNNLLNETDIKDAYEFLPFLALIDVDGLIIQDLSILEIVKELGLSFNLHSSVMMNVHNKATIEALKQEGITRVVASREMSLADVKSLSLETGMEFEYFTHGDMCIAHGSQCHYSGILFGKSSNRGLCMKPCRWHFDIKQGENIYKTGYPMAVKDMYMYENIHQMIDANITSFKIEGRMRDIGYLKNLVNLYSGQIQSYIDDPLGFNPTGSREFIFENRKRDLSTAYAFSKPGLSNINKRFEGTGIFYSTGKVFSNPIEEIETTEDRIEKLKNILVMKGAAKKQKDIKLTVQVNNMVQALACIEEEVDTIYLNGEVFLPDLAFSINQIKELTRNKYKTKIYLKTPRMMYGIDFSKYHHILGSYSLDIDGLLVSNLGAICDFKKYDLDIVGDYCLNIYNQKALAFYEKCGLNRQTLSLELNAVDAKELLINSPLETEVVVHGKPVVMYLEHDIYANAEKEDKDKQIIQLVDALGYEHPIYKDIFGRNHMTLYKDLCLLPISKELNDLGVGYFRIEGLTYGELELREIIHAYRVMSLDGVRAKKGFTLGSFQYK